jgi:hypothetical protein
MLEPSDLLLKTLSYTEPNLMLCKLGLLNSRKALSTGVLAASKKTKEAICSVQNVKTF